MTGSHDAELYCFLDTSIFIECRPFRAVDWPAELGAERVCLVIAPSVFDELESHKTDPRSDRRRNRARATIAAFARDLGEGAWSDEGATLGRTVRIRCLVSEAPPHHYEAQNLSHHQGDDQLIASVIAFRAQGHLVALLTADFGLFARARSRGIDASCARDELREKDEPNPQSRAIERLSARVAELEEQIRIGGKSTPDVLALLRDTIDHPPVPAHETYAYLHILAKPLSSDNSLLDTAVKAQPATGTVPPARELLSRLLGDAASWPLYPREYYPDLPVGSLWRRVADGWRFRRTDGPLQTEDGFDPGGMLDLFVGRNGTGLLFCGRAGDTPRSGRLQLFEDSIASLATRFLFLMGSVCQVARYEDDVDVALAVTGAGGAISSHLASLWMGLDPVPYAKDEYIEARRFRALQLRRNARECARDLTAELFDALTGEMYDPYAGLPIWKPDPND